MKSASQGEAERISLATNFPLQVPCSSITIKHTLMCFRICSSLVTHLYACIAKRFLMQRVPPRPIARRDAIRREANNNITCARYARLHMLRSSRTRLIHTLDGIDVEPYGFPSIEVTSQSIRRLLTLDAPEGYTRARLTMWATKPTGAC